MAPTYSFTGRLLSVCKDPVVAKLLLDRAAPEDLRAPGAVPECALSAHDVMGYVRAKQPGKAKVAARSLRDSDSQLALLHEGPPLQVLRAMMSSGGLRVQALAVISEHESSSVAAMATAQLTFLARGSDAVPDLVEASSATTSQLRLLELAQRAVQGPGRVPRAQVHALLSNPSTPKEALLILLDSDRLLSGYGVRLAPTAVHDPEVLEKLVALGPSSATAQVICQHKEAPIEWLVAMWPFVAVRDELLRRAREGLVPTSTATSWLGSDKLAPLALCAPNVGQQVLDEALKSPNMLRWGPALSNSAVPLHRAVQEWGLRGEQLPLVTPDRMYEAIGWLSRRQDIDVRTAGILFEAYRRERPLRVLTNWPARPNGPFHDVADSPLREMLLNEQFPAQVRAQALAEVLRGAAQFMRVADLLAFCAALPTGVDVVGDMQWPIPGMKAWDAAFAEPSTDVTAKLVCSYFTHALGHDKPAWEVALSLLDSYEGKLSGLAEAALAISAT